ncbi:MAG: hypothetical protein H7Y03_14480 [Chitinophagaceae bacterium]|nr:hypothetical protein [Chitinophagaceae bacterium]
MRNLLVFLFIQLAAGCGGAGKDASKDGVNDKQKVELFPVTTFIKGQIHIVDSFQSVTMKYETNGNKTDSGVISIEAFKKLAAEFYTPDFNEPGVKELYKESSFADQSIKAVTFNYSTEDEDASIRRVDVVVDAHAVLSDKVRSIYMEKQRRQEDTFFYKKLYWRADRNFQIITTKQVGKSTGIVNVTKVEWN